jgi:hypothetical protein
MSRDSLLPKRFTRIDPRFKTPRAAIVLTGGLLLGLIAFVPVVELAKLASAFRILVFSIPIRRGPPLHGSRRRVGARRRTTRVTCRLSFSRWLRLGRPRTGRVGGVPRPPTGCRDR